MYMWSIYYVPRKKQLNAHASCSHLLNGKTAEKQDWTMFSWKIEHCRYGTVLYVEPESALELLTAVSVTNVGRLTAENSVLRSVLFISISTSCLFFAVYTKTWPLWFNGCKQRGWRTGDWDDVQVPWGFIICFSVEYNQFYFVLMTTLCQASLSHLSRIQQTNRSVQGWQKHHWAINLSRMCVVTLLCLNFYHFRSW